MVYIDRNGLTDFCRQVFRTIGLSEIEADDSENTSARVCHFFGAIRLDLFRDPEAFKADMGRMLDELNALRPAEGCERVYYAGQKEHEAEERSWKCGVPVTEKLYDELCGIGLQILGRKLERLS